MPKAEDRLTLSQRLFILEEYLSSRSYAKTIDKFKLKYADHPAPNKTSIFRLVKKFRTEFTLKDAERKPRPSVLTPENLEKVRTKFQQNRSVSLRKASAQLGLSRMSIQRATKKLNLKPYRVTIHQELKFQDCPKREFFSQWLINFAKDNQAVFDNVFFSDEAWFYLDGFINSQTYRVWSTENPHAYREKGLHPKKVGVWCAISRKRIVGPIFFEGIINSEVYARIIQDFVALLEPDERYCWFQQDGARCHTSNETMAYLKTFFDDRLISKGLWPPRSPDLTPLDFYLWGYLKEKIFRFPPVSIEGLKSRIESEIHAINQTTLKKVFRSLMRRALTCKHQMGGHIQHLL